MIVIKVLFLLSQLRETENTFFSLASSPYSGAEISAASCARSLASAGHKVFLLTSKTSKTKSKTKNFVVLPLLDDRLFLFSKELGYLHVKRTVSKIIDKEEIDYIFADSNLLWVGAISAAKDKGKKVAIHFHDYGFMCPKMTLLNNKMENCSGPGTVKCLCCYLDRPLKLFWPIYFNLSLRWQNRIIVEADTIFCVSDFVKNIAKGHYKTTNFALLRRIIKLPSNIEIACELFDIVYSGRLSKEKGIDDIIKAIAIVKKERPEVKLTIIGEGPFRKELEALTKKLSLQENVCFVGKKDHAKTIAMVSAARMIVFSPIWNEPSGRTQFEAMAVGTPVIISSVGGLKEEFNAGCGEIVTSRNPKQLADTIERLFRRNLSKKQVKDAAKGILENHSEEKIVKQIEACY